MSTSALTTELSSGLSLQDYFLYAQDNVRRMSVYIRDFDFRDQVTNYFETHIDQINADFDTGGREEVAKLISFDLVNFLKEEYQSFGFYDGAYQSMYSDMRTYFQSFFEQYCIDRLDPGILPDIIYLAIHASRETLAHNDKRDMRYQIQEEMDIETYNARMRRQEKTSQAFQAIKNKATEIKDSQIETGKAIWNAPSLIMDRIFGIHPH